MGFLDTPAPNPRTKEYYHSELQWAATLIDQALELDHSPETLDTLLKLYSIREDRYYKSLKDT